MTDQVKNANLSGQYGIFDIHKNLPVINPQLEDIVQNNYILAGTSKNPYHTIILKCKAIYVRKIMQDHNFNEYFDRFPLAMAYVPWQHLTNIFEDLDEAYKTGTIFPELEKPFTGRRCVK